MAIKHEMITSFRKSLDSIFHTLKTEAPRTLRTPISLVLCSATKEVSPNKPKQLMKIARAVKIQKGFRCALLTQIFCRIAHLQTDTRKEYPETAP